MVALPAAPNEANWMLTSTAKYTGYLSVHAVSKEASQRRTSPGAPSDVFGPVSDAPTGTTANAEVENAVVLSGEQCNKTQVCLRWENAQISGMDSHKKARDPVEGQVSNACARDC
jgi:hypothetical protein